MNSKRDQDKRSTSQSAFNLSLVAVAGQVGCLTLVIVLASLFGGLWLDNQFQTKPVITVGLMLLSVPVTLVMMFWVVRTATRHLNTDYPHPVDFTEEEEESGKTP